jgi:hypothetical protein
VTAELVPFGELGNDMPNGLRRLADQIENGVVPAKFIVAVVVKHEPHFITYAWGNCSGLEAVGALAQALTTKIMEE